MITKISSDENNLVFIAEISQSFVNAWRRSMFAEVPVMAIDDVEIIKNSSSMFDETIANRLGLIPLVTDLESYNFSKRCTCKGEGCAKCTVKLTLKESKPGMVYASSIHSKDPKIVPVYGKTPIVWLLQNHEVALELTARLGKGKEHAKYSPGLIYFRAYPKLSNEQISKIIDKCPEGLFEKKGNSYKMNEEKLIDFDIDDVAGFDEIPSEDDKYIVFIESWGQLPPKEIAIQGLNELEIKAKEFENAIKLLDK